MMNPENPGLAIGAGLLAFHSGLMRGRARHAAYQAAVIEGRRQDAQERRIRRLEADLARERQRNDAAAVRANAAAMLSRLKG